jgi:hypothetical protein
MKNNTQTEKEWEDIKCEIGIKHIITQIIYDYSNYPITPINSIDKYFPEIQAQISTSVQREREIWKAKLDHITDIDHHKQQIEDAKRELLEEIKGWSKRNCEVVSTKEGEPKYLFLDLDKLDTYFDYLNTKLSQLEPREE